MAKKNMTFIVDTFESDYSPVGVVKQLDSVIFNITVTENSTIKSLNNQNIKLFAKKPDKTKVEQTEGINITNSTNGELTIDLKNSALQSVGLVYFELELKDSEGTISTANFIIRVDEKLGSNEAIESTNEFDTFEKIKLEEQKRQESEKERDKIFKGLITEGTEFNGSLENNINLAETLNTNLAENIKLAGPLNTSLNEKIPEAATKKSELESSIVEAKKFIDGLDGSQNIPGIRMELTELKNGLKSNQALGYEGSSIVTNETLEGRTEGMKIKGRTLNNLYKANNIREDAGGKYILVDTFEEYAPKNRVVYIVNNTNRILLLNVYRIGGGWDSNPIIRENSISKLDLTGKKLTGFLGMYDRGWTNSETDKELLRNTCIVLDREETYIPQKYFEGLKSFGEAEQEGDKYKISILSNSKNLCDVRKAYIDYTGFSFVTDNNNKLSITGTTNNQWAYVGIPVELRPNIDLTFSFKGSGNNNFLKANIILESNKNNSLTGDISANSSKTFRVNERCTAIIKLFFSGATTGNFNVDYWDIQLEEGQKSTPCEPYQSDKKDILISAPLPGFDFGEDIMYEDNGQVKITRNIDTYTFTGDETMRDTTEQDEKSGTGKYKVFVLTINKTIDKNKNINNNFPKKQFSVAFQKVDSEGLAITQYGVYIKILKSKLSTQDAEGLKAWLKANQTVIYFSRATPVTEIVENCVDIDLDTYQEKTYFNILNSLPGTLDFRVPSNLGSVVQNMAKEINDIWDVINNLLVPGLMDTKKTLALKTIKNNLK
ncbi:BppU family phage baseplate upper protein [Clostridium perfringens]|nr:BppU family phage baseplate upper protein [Clostridium perfringens]